MQGKKNNIVTMVLLSSVIVLLVVVLGIGYFLSQSAAKPSSAPVGPKKVKASNIGYSKLIILNKSQDIPAPTSGVSPTRTVFASPTVQPTLATQASPTQEILLAQNNLSPTAVISASPSATLAISASPSATIVRKLPVTGTVANSLVIILIAAGLVFFSFVF